MTALRSTNASVSFNCVGASTRFNPPEKSDSQIQSDYTNNSNVPTLKTKMIKKTKTDFFITDLPG